LIFENATKLHPEKSLYLYRVAGFSEKCTIKKRPFLGVFI
jgi:hypothetical protein